MRPSIRLVASQNSMSWIACAMAWPMRSSLRTCSGGPSKQAWGCCIDDAGRLGAGASQAVLPLRVMAPSTVGSFVRSFTFGHVRRLDKVQEAALGQAWSVGAAPGVAEMTVDLDSTVCEVCGRAKHGAACGHTKVLGYHPLVAVRSDTGEVLHSRMRSGSSQRGHDGEPAELRLIVRRSRLIGAQRELWPNWRYHCFVTDRADLDTVAADAYHRGHATVELAIRDLKENSGLSRCPSGRFFANGAWLACCVLAHNLAHNLARLGGAHPAHQLTVAATIRNRLLAVPARLVNHSGRRKLRLPSQWPWATAFTTALQRIRNLPLLI